MFTLLDNSEKIDEITVENDSVWKQIPLRDFGSKCISNEHNLVIIQNAHVYAIKKRKKRHSMMNFQTVYVQ